MAKEQLENGEALNGAPHCAPRNGAQGMGLLALTKEMVVAGDSATEDCLDSDWDSGPCGDSYNSYTYLRSDAAAQIYRAMIGALPAANARLIAAAPDLLAAAKATADWWEEHKYDTEGYDCGDGYMDEYNVYDTSNPPTHVALALAAIAKAEGRTDA